MERASEGWALCLAHHAAADARWEPSGNPCCRTHPTGGIVTAPALRDHRPPASVRCHVTMGLPGSPPVSDPVCAIPGAGVQFQQYFAASDGISLGQTSFRNAGAVRRCRHSSHFVHRWVQCRAVGALQGGGAAGQQRGGETAIGKDPEVEGRREEKREGSGHTGKTALLCTRVDVA